MDWDVRKHTQQIVLGRAYSSYSMRTTSIKTVLDKGAKLEDVQRTVGHADPAATQLYDQRRCTPTKSAALAREY